MKIEKAHGQLCWTLEQDDKKVFVTIQGGNLTCQFNTENGIIDPYAIAPWWNEPVVLELDNLSQVLRGDFFCFPFGADEGKDPITYHGETASGYWTPTDTDSKDEGILELEMKLEQGNVRKSIEVREGEPLIYQRHTISGFEGAMPFGYHPMLRFPEKLNLGRVTISQPLSGYTTPEPIELPENGGYSRIKSGCEISDMTAVPCTDGSLLDLTTYPHTPGYEEIVMFTSNPDLPFAFSAVTIPEEGYLYFQLKNPSILRQTILWMSNGGRWYAPWNGRVQRLLGIEEVTAFFHYGISASTEENFLSKAGIPTSYNFKKDESFDIPLISGLVPIGPTFKRVRTIEQTGDSEITLVSESDDRIRVHCSLEFLL